MKLPKKLKCCFLLSCLSTLETDGEDGSGGYGGGGGGGGGGRGGTSNGGVNLALALDKRMSFISEDKRGTSTVELVKKESATLGIMFLGGIDRGSRPKISSLRPGSVAHRSDALAVGDYLVSVNGTKTAKLKHDEIASLLKNSGEKVVLEVEYEIPDSPAESCVCACPKVIQVQLTSENRSFGLTLRGGAHCNDKLKSRPLVVTHVRPAGPADREGTIKAGDRILAVDGLNLTSATLVEAMTVLKRVDREAILTIEYDVSVLESVRNALGPLLVEIDKTPGTPLGISLTRLPRPDGAMVIESIRQASIAERCGALHVGDHILSVNGTRVDQLTAAEAMQLLRTNTTDVTRLETLPISQMAAPTRRHDQTRVKPAAVAKGSSSYGPYCYNTLSSYGGHSSSSSRQPLMPQGPGRGARKRAQRYLNTFPSTGSLSSSSTTAVLTCGQLCHMEVTEVCLSAGLDGGFGFSIQGANPFASELLSSPPIINHIDAGGPADKSGVLQVGDRLLSVNDRSTEGLPSCEVVQLISQSGPRLVLELEFDVAESVVPSSGTFTVKLAKGAAGLGITITAPKNRKPGEPLIISDIKRGSLAHRTGTLQPGDRLLAIDSVRMDNCTVQDAAEILQASHQIVKLRIRKDETFSEEPDSPGGAVVYTVELVRHGGPLGITISGTEEPFDPILVSGLTQGGLAEKTGALHVGDRLLAINGHSLRGKPLSEAIQMLQNSGDIVTLKISKVPPTKTEKGSPQTPGKNNGVEGGHFLESFVSQAIPSVDSAVESWDSTGLLEVCTTQGPNRDKAMEKTGEDSEPPAGCEPLPSPPIPVCSPHGEWEGRTDQWEVRTTRSNSTEGKNDWSRALEDLETCGESQLLRQIEKSIMGSEQSLCPRTFTDEGYHAGDQDDLEHYSLLPSFPETSNHHQQQQSSGGSSDTTFLDPYSLPVPLEVHRVTLFKDGVYEDFGFSVSDGLYDRGVFVNRIRKGGPADLCGMLRRYDRILQVNDTRTHDFDCCLTVPLIAAAGDCIQLVVSRPAYTELSCSGNSTLGRNSLQNPWMDEGDREECISPVPPSSLDSYGAALLTKTL